MNPDRCLVRYQFMEFLVRCAKDKFTKQTSFGKQGTAKSVSEAMQFMFDRHLIPYCKTLDYNVRSFVMALC